MNTKELIATLVKQDLVERIQKNKVNENQLLVISDLSYPVLQALERQLLADSNSEFQLVSETSTTKIPTIKKSGREIIPYLINEQEASVKRSQAFAGKLRNSMESTPGNVRWLVIMGEPQQVEIDTFTSTGQWLVKSPSANKTYFDRLFEAYLASDVPTELRGLVRDLRKTLYALKLSENELEELLKYLNNVKLAGNTTAAMAQHLRDLHLLPSNNEEAIKVQNLKKNQAFCEEVRAIGTHLEDLDYWVEEHVQQEAERDQLREVLRAARSEPDLLVERFASSVKLEQVVSLNEQQLSPLHFDGRDALRFKEGVQKFLEGNARVLQLTNQVIKLQYRFIREPLEAAEHVGLSINNGTCYILPGFSSKEGEVDLDLSQLGILQELSDNRVCRVEIGLLDPEKHNKIRDKKGVGKKINKFEFFIYPNLSERPWNVYEMNEEFFFETNDNQCIVGWEELLKFSLTGSSDKVKAWMRIDDSDEAMEEEDQESFEVELTREGDTFTIGATELKQIRNRVHQSRTLIDEKIPVELVVSDDFHTFNLTFIVGAEADISALNVQSIQEGIIRFLHHDDVKRSMSSDRSMDKLPLPLEIKIVGGNSGDHIRFRVYQKVEGGYSSVYSIRYPSVLKDLEREFLKTPLVPFPREYVEATGEVRLKDHPNWQQSFTGQVGDTFQSFLDVRNQLFSKIYEVKTFKGMIVVNLLPFEELVDEYVSRFDAILQAVSDMNRVLEQYTGLLMIDTVFSTDGLVLMMAPTHPLKMKATLELQKLLAPLVESIEEPITEFAYTIGNIQQLNHQYLPPYLKISETYYKAKESPYLFWGHYLRTGENVLATEGSPLLSSFIKTGSKSNDREGRMSGAIRNRMDVFLQSYPHLEQSDLPITINCFLSKHSQFVFAAIYDLAKEKKHLSWRINFIITDMEDANDQKAVLKERIYEFRERVLRSEEEALILRKMHYSIQVLNLGMCADQEIPYAHLTLLSNLFETTITEHEFSSFPPALVNQGLTALPKTFFSYADNSYYTGLTLRQDRSDLIESTAGRWMSVIACLKHTFKPEVALFSHTNLQPLEMEKINKILKRSVWVCFLEKEVGVEKFDAVMGDEAPYYLVDYLNKYSANIGGYDLLTITQKREEMKSAIQKHLLKDKYNMQAHDEIAETMLNAINCLSGRWALRLIGGSPTEISGLIGSLQVFLFYKNVVRIFDPVLDENRTVLSVMIPLDEYMGVAPRRTDGWFVQNADENYKSCCDDFLLVRIEETRSGRLRMKGKLIEVKFSKDRIGLAVISKAKEQLFNARNIMQDRFLKSKFNQTFKRTEWAELIYFHVMKFLRNGIYSVDEDVKERIGTFMRWAYNQILDGRYDLTFDYAEGLDPLVHGEVVALMPSVDDTEPFRNLISDHRRVLLLFESAISAIYNQEEADSARFQRLRNLLDWNQEEKDLHLEFLERAPELEAELPSEFISVSEHQFTQNGPQMAQEKEQVGLEPHNEQEQPTRQEETDLEEQPDGQNNPEKRARSICHDHMDEEIENVEQPFNDLVSKQMDFKSEGVWVGSDAQGDEVTLNPNVLMKHVAVLGSTGSGKTRLAKAFIEEVTRHGVPSLIIDPQGDIARLIESANRSGHKAEDFYDKAEVRVFTPASYKGIQFSFNPLQMPKEEVLANITDSYEREEYLTTVFDSIASNLLSVLSRRDEQAHTFLVTVFERLHRLGQSEISIQDVASFIYRSESFPLEMTDDEVEMLISKSNKNNLVRDLNGLNVGMNKALFNLGFIFNMDELMKPVTPGKIPVNIVYLNSLDSDQKKQFCVSVICNELYKWMLKNPSPDLQLVFYIDEVGPYMPPQNVKKPASKDILLRLYKESRKYGIGCILCTQNPGDVDSKILNNANTWCIGKIIPKHFESIRKLVEDSASQNVPNMSQVSNFPSGDFMIVSSEAFGTERMKRVHVRELYTVHDTPYTLDDLEMVIPEGIRNTFVRNRN